MEWLDRIEAEWRDAVLRWKKAVDDYDAAIQAHLANRKRAEEIGDGEAWMAQWDKALHVQTAIQMLQEGLAATSGWAKQTLGLAGLARMGFIPLIPVAVIVGSISAVTAVTYSLYSYNSELERKWNYIQARPDLTPAEIKQVLDAGPPGVLGNLGNSLMWIVIGGLLLYFGPQLLKMKR